MSYRTLFIILFLFKREEQTSFATNKLVFTHEHICNI